MTPNKSGQVVKFHTPLPNENPNQQYVIQEIHFDVEKPRAKIKELNGGAPFPSIHYVLVQDLKVVELDTANLIGQIATINKSDFSQVKGKVIKVDEQKIMLDLTKGVTGVETNVWLTIIDENGKEQIGTLFVDMQHNH